MREKPIGAYFGDTFINGVTTRNRSKTPIILGVRSFGNGRINGCIRLLK